MTPAAIIMQMSARWNPARRGGHKLGKLRNHPIPEAPTYSHILGMTDLASLIIGHYERHAADWDRDRQSNPWNDRIWHEHFADCLPKGAKVLDLGCGSGHPVAQYMAGRGLAVTGVDSSPKMIALYRSRLPDQKWIVADIRGLSLGRTFDGVLSWDSFFHLNHADQRQMFSVFAKHATNHAVLMFNAGPMHGEGVGSYRGDPLYHASLAPEEYAGLLGQYGFDVLEHVVNDRRAGGRTAWLCRRRGE
jgi:SAM-dependent methyltransferase